MKLLDYLLTFDYSNYFILMGRTLAIYFIFKFFKYIIVLITTRWIKRSKHRFMFHQSVDVILSIICAGLIILLWYPYLKSVMQIVSFVSAGITIAVRDVILNLFAGFYIKTKKPFKLEDRITIDNITGDVILINHLSFKVLEVEDKINGGQSSGIIINIPNSFIFSKSLKNYNTAFKYIWDEINIRVKIDSDIEKNKKELLKIVNSNEIVAEIPKKMKKEIKEATTDYRIYYNHFDPIIYTKINNNYVELNLRFLTHPKKARIVEDYLWTNILKQYKKNKIDLFVE